MKNEFVLGKIAGLQLKADNLVVLSYLLLWGVLSTVGLLFLKLSWPAALLGGLVAAVLHWASELVHNLGHARAARRTGYPMIGIRFWLLLATSLYSPDEPELPAEIHIQRALGGPAASSMLALVAGLIAAMLQRMGSDVAWLAIFVFLDNLFVFTLGALVPMSFTDGSTILRWLPRR